MKYEMIPRPWLQKWQLEHKCIAGCRTYNQVMESLLEDWDAYQWERLPLYVKRDIENQIHLTWDSLIDKLYKMGLVEEAVILTSMQQSIEYIRTHYPQLTCQWLRHNVQEEDYAWCEQWNVTLSVPHTSVTEQVIARSQQIGKAVATWTVNEIADYERVIQLGCKYVTTDYLEIP